jgi:hypothetical protein
MFDVEQLKVIATVLGLVISTATIQYTSAKFVNDVRDSMLKDPPHGIDKVSQLHDLCWGYALAIAFNGLFCMVAYIVMKQSVDTGLVWLGRAVFAIFAVNAVLWVTGSVLDIWRACKAVPKAIA